MAQSESGELHALGGSQPQVSRDGGPPKAITIFVPAGKHEAGLAIKGLFR